MLSTRAQENLTGVRVIRAYVQEKPEIAAFDRANRDYVDTNIKLIGSWSLFFPALAALIGLTVMILLGMGGVQVIDQRVSLGTFLAFYSFLIQLVFPMIAIGWVTNIFQRGAASMGRLNYILTAEPNIQDAPSAQTEAPKGSAGGNGRGHESGSDESRGGQSDIRGEIEFRHLTFAYPTGPTGAPGPAVLHDINLHVPAGSTLAIVGPTGSGKSTLAALIARLWEAPPGTLLIDGRPIREYSARNIAPGDRIRARRIRFSSAKLCAKTSPSASMTPPRSTSSKRPRSRASREKFKVSPLASTRWSASAASLFPAGKSSGPRWRARFFASLEFWCWTTPFRAWIPIPKNASSADCGRSCGSEPRF